MSLLVSPEDAVLRRLERTGAAIGRAIYTPVADLTVEGWVTDEPVAFEQRMSGRPVSPIAREPWGKLWDCAWFHLTGTVPEAAKGCRTVLLIDVGGEACVVGSDGEPVLGLTPAASGFDAGFGSGGKRAVPLFDEPKGGEAVDSWVEAGCNDLFGDLAEGGRFVIAAVATEDRETHALYYDFTVLLDLARTLPPTSARQAKIIAALGRAAGRLRTYEPDEIAVARLDLAPELAKRGGSPSLAAVATGQAHLDLAWLWPVRETIRKGGRTFATVLALMDRYPDYAFGASQPQLYQWMKERYPGLYARIKKQIAGGRWEPQGAMWVEADVNMPTGESLVRQLLYGRRFYWEEFKHEPRVAWLPDNFGFQASLPQILTKSGLDYFLTIKLSWNSTTVFPRHSFWWHGLDGSRVLAHMPPEGTYNSAALPHSVARIETAYMDKDVSQNAALLYGVGDGGGGPGIEHLERLDRIRDLEGLPRVQHGTSMDLFGRLEAEGVKLRRWDGELYLEFHQGTFTSQSHTKRLNRKLEVGLHDAELMAVMAARNGCPYPRERLERIWKEVLLHQFHDILPGSSITRVYDESNARQELLLAEVRELAARAATDICDPEPAGTPKRPAGSKGRNGEPGTRGHLVVNTLPWSRSEWIQVEGGWRFAADVPSLGCRLLEADEPIPSISAGTHSIENEFLRAQFDLEGALTSLVDKPSGRECLAGPANVFTGYADEGNAWDFPPEYRNGVRELARLVLFEAIVEGPQATMRQRYELGKSVIEQDITLLSARRRLEFDTRVAWHETHTMLRVAFPTSVRSGVAVGEIQYGSVRRPTHRNTDWDKARDEFCAHRWVDLSQRDFGVSLLNDCKYGHSVRENVLELNLLRSPTTPDPTADQGFHQFTYALYPHDGDHVYGDVPRQAYELNLPLRVFPVLERPALAPFSLFTLDGAAVILDWVKQAEDSNDIVVRLYEWAGGSETANLRCYFPIQHAWSIDLMERPEHELHVEDSGVRLSFTPFQIQTIRLG